MPSLISDLALSSTFTHVGKNSAGSSRPQLKNSSLIPRACETQLVVKHLLLFLLNVLNKMFSRWENQEQWADHFLNNDKSNKRQQRKYVLMHWRTKKKKTTLKCKNVCCIRKNESNFTFEPKKHTDPLFWLPQRTEAVYNAWLLFSVRPGTVGASQNIRDTSLIVFT